MARRKQAAALQRELLDSNGGLPEPPSQEWKGYNGSVEKSTAITPNGKPKGASTKPIQEPAAGLSQLLICVGGIYVSL